MSSNPMAAKSVELAEEEKLKQKYPSLNRKGIGTSLLQKRLNKGHKYFDSGDYNMAKARVGSQQHAKQEQQEQPLSQESMQTQQQQPAPPPPPPQEQQVAAAAAVEPSAPAAAGADAPDAAGPQQQLLLLQEATGETIPTPENIPTARRRSLTGPDQHQITHPEQCIVQQHHLQQQHQQQQQAE